MSTLRVNTLQNTSTTDGGISIDTSGHVTVDGVAMPSTGPLSNRNLIINGAMQVAQRGTSQTGITSSTYAACDRFRTVLSGLGTWTASQDTSAPSGFSNSFKLTCTTADASPAAGDLIQVRYYAEAQDLQSLGFGTSDAKSTTMSFWVRSNKTGNASFTIQQRDNSSKQVSFQYSISSADTWEYKTISIPADTSGVINNDNGQGFEITWTLNSGTNYSSGSHQSTWGTYSNTNINPSNLGVGGATSDYFAITGVQLEVGSVATPFEHRGYGHELGLCQRYYYKSSEIRYLIAARRSFDTGQAVGTLSLPTTMRDTPTVTDDGNFDGGVYAGTYSGDLTWQYAAPDFISFATANSIGGGGILWVYGGTVFCNAEL